MNVFKALASGRWGFREEFMSAFIGYLLHPDMDHKLGTSFLKTFLMNISDSKACPFISEIIRKIDSYKINFDDDVIFSDNVLDGNGKDKIRVQLECREAGNADIVLSLFDETYIIIENKILSSSFADGQLKEEYDSICNCKYVNGKNIISIYLVPESIVKDASKSVIGLSETYSHDFFSVITWDKSSTGYEYPSITEMLNNLPNHNITELKLFVDFIKDGFRGYRNIVDRKNTPDEITVGEALLHADEKIYIGVWAPLVLIDLAWKNPSFIDKIACKLQVKPNFMYIELEKFKKITTWAMNPEASNLTGVHFDNDFGLRGLYRVCRYGKIGNSLYINLKPNGILKNRNKINNTDLLKSLSKEEILKLDWRELHAQSTQSRYQITGKEFIDILSDKGITDADFEIV